MKTLTYDNLDLKVYEEVLDNGLTVYLSKIPRYSIHARMTTLFGGSILEFKTENEENFNKVPAGVAHFLEHKLFDKKDYEPLVTFENNGASANAFTNEFITSFYFTSASLFEENLSMLLKLVYDPYFTDKNVSKEKGIISQEKKEDMDNNYSIVYDKSLKNIFHNIDFKNTVLGTLEDINSITKEDLYKCYNTFYHPSNMILTISGDIDIEKTMKLIKDFYKNHDFGKQSKINIKEKKEPETVVKERDVILKDTKVKEVYISYKVKKLDKIKDKYLNKLYFSTLIDMKFSGLSEIADIVHNDKNILSSISSRVTDVDDYYIVSFIVTVKKDTEKVIKLIDDNLKDMNFEIKRFNLIKKAILNSLVLSLENPYEICSMLVNQKRMYGKLLTDIHTKILNLDFNTFKDFIKEADFSNRSIIILKSKKTS